jgi:hypothetical protein
MKNIEQVIETAMKYDMAAVMKRYQENTRLPEDVLKEHEREIKRFLALSAANNGKYGMRGPLDELWHTFILFTSSYARFCRLLGGGFIHHFPESPTGRRKKNKSQNNSYAKFLADYESVFKESPPRHLWPRPLGSEVMDPSCNQCGIFCDQTCVAMELLPQTKRF